MKTKISSGDTLTITSPAGGTVSGIGVLIGSMFGIPVTSSQAGDLVSIDIEGEFDHVAEGAVAGQAWAIGDTVYFDANNKRLTKTAAGNTKIGYATLPKASTDVVGRVNLIPFAA